MQIPMPCSTDDVVEGECTKYFLCRKNFTINTDGSIKTGTITIRLDDDLKECDPLEPCCYLDRIDSTPMERHEIASSCGVRNENGIGFKLDKAISQQAEICKLYGDSIYNNIIYICLRIKFSIRGYTNELRKKHEEQKMKKHLSEKTTTVEDK